MCKLSYLSVKKLERLKADNWVGANGTDYEARYGREELELLVIEKISKYNEKLIEKEIEEYNFCA